MTIIVWFSIYTIGLVKSWRWSSKPFWFEAMWVGAKGCEDIIKNSWQSIEHADSITETRSVISSCNQHWMLWQRSQFGNLQLWSKQKELNCLLEGPPSLFFRFVWTPLKMTLIFYWSMRSWCGHKVLRLYNYIWVIRILSSFIERILKGG